MSVAQGAVQSRRRAALQWVPLPGDVRVYRVEGLWNQRICLDSAARSTVHGHTMLFINCGHRERAFRFWTLRASQGMPAVAIRSFKVRWLYLRWLSYMAVPERLAATYRLRPIRVDTRWPHQYGLRRELWSDLLKGIVRGTGRVWDEP